jgi:hypothetical protein
MSGPLSVKDLQKIPSIQSLPVFDPDDRKVQRCLRDEGVCEFAEAADAMRLCELLHRSEYQPVAVVRNRKDRFSPLRVIFRPMHETDFLTFDDRESSVAEPSIHPKPR